LRVGQVKPGAFLPTTIGRRGSHYLRAAIFTLTMFEVVIIERGPTRWEWQVCNRDGVQIVHGREKTRAEARYQGNRALFSLLLGRGPRHFGPDLLSWVNQNVRTRFRNKR
jgi:hypothetical protein